MLLSSGSELLLFSVMLEIIYPARYLLAAIYFILVSTLRYLVDKCKLRKCKMYANPVISRETILLKRQMISSM